MARASNNPEQRIERLTAAKARVGALKRGTKLTSGPMAELLDVRWPALRDWCSDISGFEASGAFVRGGNGIEWQFDAKKTVDFLLKHFRGVIERQAKESRRITKAIGVNMAESEAAPSLAETKDLVNLTLTVVAAQERMHNYTPVDEVSDFIAGYNDAVIDGIMGVKTKVDPNGHLPAAVRKRVEEHLRSVAAAVHAKAQTYIEAANARFEQGGTGRAR